MTARKYRLRILRNLLIAAVLLVLLWREAGYPLPTMEMELHRWERRTLQEVSEIIWSIDQTGSHGPKMLVGVNRDSIIVRNRSNVYQCWPRYRDRAALIALIDRIRYWPEDGISLGSPALLAIDPPRGAEQARLTLTLFLEDPAWRETYEIEGERQGEVFFFLLLQKYYSSSSTWEERGATAAQLRREEEAVMGFTSAMTGEEALNRWPWRLEFFDEAGNLLEEQFSDSFHSFYS